jgi:hypothetical protein
MSDQNQELKFLSLPNEQADKVPIKLTHTQMKNLMKQMRRELKGEPSEKQKAHIEKLKEMNKQRLEKQKEEKQKKIEESSKKIMVAPKRVYKKQQAPKKDFKQYNQSEEEEEVEVIEEVIKKPLGSKSHAIPSGWKKKKIIKKVVEQSSEEESSEDEYIQKTKKATKIVETVSKLDKAINQIKSTGNRYDSLLSKFKF